jgi:hypothetical protein
MPEPGAVNATSASPDGLPSRFAAPTVDPFTSPPTPHRSLPSSGGGGDGGKGGGGGNGAVASTVKTCHATLPLSGSAAAQQWQPNFSASMAEKPGQGSQNWSVVRLADAPLGRTPNQLASYHSVASLSEEM